MTESVAVREKGELTIYNPDEGLKMIATSEAGEKHWRRAKDATHLIDAIERKIDAQADYVVWRDGVTKRGGDGSNQYKKRAKIVEQQSLLPKADPGDDVAHLWRKKLTHKVEGKTTRDEERIEQIKSDARLRCIRICEQQNANTIRGTEGTGEFERYTPAEYIEAVRAVFGEIDLDPATSEQAQQTVRASEYFTQEDNGLEREWRGRVFLNPPYHRELAPQFIAKLIAEIAAGRTESAIVLTNNSTDTEWFLAAVCVCSSICFTNGRVKFTVPKGDDVLPTQGQSFFYFGADANGFEDVFCQIGFCVRPSHEFVGVESCVQTISPQNGED